MIYGAPLLVASLATTLAGLALLLLAVVTAVLSVVFFRRARSREAFAPTKLAEEAQSVSEMRALGDRIETLVSQQQLQGETQRQRLGQQIDEVRQVVSQQGHRVDGLRGELHHEMKKRDHEIEEIRQQLTAIQRSGAALPAAETAALPAPAPEPRALPPAREASAEPASTAEPDPMPELVSSGDSFAGVEALPPMAPPFRPVEAPEAQPAAPAETAPPAYDAFGDAVSSDAPPLSSSPILGAPPAAPPRPPESVAPEPVAHEPAAPEPTASEFVASEPVRPEPVASEHGGADYADTAGAPPEPVASEAAPPKPEVPFSEPEVPFSHVSVFSDMGFDAFSPGEPAAPTSSVASWDVTPTEPPTPGFQDAAAPGAPAPPPDGGAWVSSQRDTPVVPVFSLEAWPEPADDWSEPAVAAAPYTPPPGADDFRFISTVTEDVQRALYLAGVTKLEEIAHWSRGDARRIAAEVGVSEETIMNQWVFEAQGALFERYSSHIAG